MYKPMTDKRLKELERLIVPSVVLGASVGNEPLMFGREGRELLNEIYRLRAEAFVWHPWPAETPEVGEYWVTVRRSNGKKDVHKNSWAGRGWLYADDVDNEEYNVIGFAEAPAPYGGE